MNIKGTRVLFSAALPLAFAGRLFAAGQPVSSDADFAAQLSAVQQASFKQVKAVNRPATDRYPDLPPTRKVEGIGISHSGTPFDIPYFSFPQIAKLIKESGGTHYRSHLPLNEPIALISKADMARLRQATTDFALLDSMIGELSKNGRWNRMDILVNAFTVQGIKVSFVTGCGYRKEAPFAEMEDGSTVQVSPDRLGRDVYVTFLKWVVGAGVRRYADRVFVWQVENEINVAQIHAMSNWRIKEPSWGDKDFQHRLLRELAAVVHNEGAKRGVVLRTTQNYATLAAEWESYVKAAGDDGIDIVGVDLYGNYFFGLPLRDKEMADIVARAKQLAGVRSVWVLEAGYSREPLVRGFSPETQAEYFKRLFDRCFRSGADVVLAFGWFWNPKGWFMDGDSQPQWWSPMAAEPYWSPIEIRPGDNGKEIFHPAWTEFHKAASKWLPR
ncbi:MAG: hypothetical protein NTX59_11100 [Elusimicrobia bacterium]|nr:hypothetical protein [Elusimicrobiota bacterium]